MMKKPKVQPIDARQTKGPSRVVRTVPVVPSQRVTPKDHLPQITNPHDLYLPEELATSAATLQGQSDGLGLSNMPSAFPQYDLPGMMFGADFQWDFNPSADDLAWVWDQMPAGSWLDTAEGWNAMLRPHTPEATPTEGDYSVCYRTPDE